MNKNYHTITSNISTQLAKLSKVTPDVLRNFHGLAGAASQDGALSAKTKELIAMAIAVAARCDGCIGFHAKACIKLGVSFEELSETLGMAVYMGGGPSLMYAAEAIQAYEEFQNA